MTKALVLLSGGIDSTTCLGIALKTNDVVEAIGINYGQRHIKELECAMDICAHYNVEQDIHTITVPDTMLTNPSVKVPDISYDEISGVSPTYVPFRNGQLLSKVAGIAQEREFDYIYFGAHAEDAHNWAYPDCTPEFIGAMANAIYIGTYHKVRLITPLMWKMKHEIITLGASLEVPYEMTWSCYKGEELHCGICPTCRSRKDAFRLAGISDPTQYAA